MPRDALVERHFKGRADRAREGLRLVWIDEQRSLEFRGGAGELRKNEHAGIGGVLRRDEFLGDKIHAVAQGSHERGVRRPVNSRQRGAAMASIDITDRGPRRVAISPVDAANLFADRAVDFGVFLDVAATGRGDL